MIAVRKKKNGLGAMLAVSTAGHLVLYFVLTVFYFPHEIKVTEQICYVDMVNLPVASPQQGSPTAVQEPAATQQPPASPVPPAPKSLPQKPANRMTLPSTAPAPPGGRTQPATEEGSAEDFQKRLSRIQEARQHEEAVEKLRKQGAATRTPQGMPTGTGTQAGSDYPSYIQSRLRDAFEPQVSAGKIPQAHVELKIDRFGATWRFKVPSGDKLFDDSVERAIKAAQKNFPPPPGGGQFSQTFLFRPEGVGKK